MLIPDFSSEPETDDAHYARQLVERVRNGAAGMEELYAMLSSGGWRYQIYRRVGYEALEDTIHDVFLIVARAIVRAELREPARLLGFIRTIIKRQPWRGYGDFDSAADEECDQHPDPEQAASAGERRALAMRALRFLPGRDREVLTRFYLNDEPEADIRRDMNLTVTQFRLTKSRAKARFGAKGKRLLAAAA